MGAKYAPSVANLLMSWWESQAIYGKNLVFISMIFLLFGQDQGIPFLSF